MPQSEKDSLFVKRLRDRGLSDADIEAVLDVMLDICQHCCDWWEAVVQRGIGNASRPSPTWPLWRTRIKRGLSLRMLLGATWAGRSNN